MEEKADFLIERTQSFPHSVTISQQSKVASVKGLPATCKAKQNRKEILICQSAGLARHKYY